MSEIYTVDRIEGEFFVCLTDDGKNADVPTAGIIAVYPECNEGWRIRLSFDSGMPSVVEILPPDKEKNEKIRARFDKIFKKTT